MQIISLNGTWELLQAGQTESMPAVVPGCVHTALLANGLLDDPFYRDNERKQMWIGETDWRYRRTFTAAPELLAHERVLLRCNGLDTLATIHLNDVEIGRTANMYRTYEFDIKPHLRAGENTISISFDAPAAYARRMDEERGKMAGWVEPMRINSGAWIRKAPCNFGWDWGPVLVTSGIWRDIALVAYNQARLADMHILQEHTLNRVELTVRLRADAVHNAPLSAAIQVRYGDDMVAWTENITFEAGAAEARLTIESPRLWWPNGMGEQPLYEVTATLYGEDGQLDQTARRIGLRTLTLERHPDQWGEAMYFACNGVPFFAKGANWIPASAYPAAAAPADYERLIRAAATANMNMLRVWGGGIYEEDVFYDLCDRLGLTIWQDFMFACGTYPSFDDAFMANVKAEAEDNVRRIRHHACLALWCGNNEIEAGLPASPGWLESMSWDDYSRLFDELLANVVRDLDPQTSYWPGSPHSPCGDRSDSMNPNCGDTHLWSVWHGKEPFEWYRTRPDRFCSEFGFQAFPHPETIQAFTIPEDRNITSYVMEHHQRSHIGNSTIIHYMLDWFRLPTSFEATVWLSQVLQGMAMKYAVEHWRRNMPRTMGALYWQLNDMWPAPSWSSIDWAGRWKALHYMAGHFFAPLLISALEHPETGTLDVHITSDLDSDRAAEIVWMVTDTDGMTLQRGSQQVTAAARANTLAATLDLSAQIAAHGQRRLLVWLELRADGQTASRNLALFARPKHMSLPDPGIQVAVRPAADESFDITLTAERPALYVWLELAGASFSDNFFDLQPGRPHTVRVQTGASLTADALRSALRVQSLVNTYQ